MEHCTNTITIRGQLQELPMFSHETHGRRFYRFFLEIPRLSGTLDILPVIAEESVLNAVDLSGGDMLTVAGQVRSHTTRTDGVRHLLVFVYAEQILCETGPAINDADLRGFLCREPTFRRTPLGREICDVMLAVPRQYRRADYIPCILWGKTAQEISLCHIRDEIRILGRLQSRVYTKQTEEGLQPRTTYEVSALSAECVTSAAN